MSQEWFRSWRNAPKDEKWLAVAAEAGVPRSLVIAVVWCLLDHGGSRPFTERGSVAGIKPRVLAAWLECSTDEVERVMAALIEFGFMTATEIRHWDKYQPVREDDSKDRVRKHRAKKTNGFDPHPPGGLHEPKRKMKRDVTQRNAGVTRGNAPESESESESESERKGTSTRAYARASRDLDAAVAADCPPDLINFYEKGRALLGLHSEQLLADVLVAKGTPERAVAAIEHAEGARSPRRYLQQVAADPPFTPRAIRKEPSMLEIAEELHRRAVEQESAHGNVVDFPLLTGTSH